MENGLRVERTLSGRPNSVRKAISAALINGVYLVAIATYGFIDICTAEFELLHTIDFADAFPAAPRHHVSAVLLTNAGQLIAAADSHVAIWASDGAASWRIHSSLQTTSRVTCLAYFEGMLFVGNDLINAWRLDAYSAATVWHRFWSEQLHGLVKDLDLSEGGQLVAAAAQHSRVAQIWRICKSKIHPLSVIWHPAKIATIQWKHGSQVLLTCTDDGVIRIWATTVDETEHFVLWATVHVATTIHKSPSMRAARSYSVVDSELDAAHTDLLTVLLEDGSLGLVTLQNIGRIPPTCLVQEFRFIARAALPPISAMQNSDLYNIHGSDARVHRPYNCGSAGSAEVYTWTDSFAVPRRQSLGPRLSGPLNSIAVAPQGDVAWTLQSEECRIGRIDLCSFLPTAEMILPGTLHICAISGNMLVAERGRLVQLVVYYGDGVIREEDSVKLAVDVQEMVLSSDDHIVCLGADGSVHIIELQANSLSILVSTTSLPPAFGFLLRGHEVVALTHDGEVILPDGRRIRIGFPPLLRAISKRGYLAVVDEIESSDGLSIWNTVESAFASGLDYRRTFVGNILSLRWIDSGSERDLLAVQHAHVVTIICKSRRQGPSGGAIWSEMASISLQNLTSVTPSALTWTPSGKIMIAFANSIALLSVRGEQTLLQRAEEAVAPLPVYHPQVLQQALARGKVTAVEMTLRRLADALGSEDSRANREDGVLAVGTSIDAFIGPLDFKQRDQSTMHHQHDLVDRILLAESAEDGQAYLSYTEQDHKTLLNALKAKDIPLLADAERLQLAALAMTVLEIKAQRRAIDLCGMRYLTAIRMQAYPGIGNLRAKPGLHFRDVVWAFHSHTQEILLQSTLDQYENKMTWIDSRSMGIFQWLRNRELIAQHMELVARTVYNATRDRDPIPCLMFYLALRKRRLVHSLWKQAVGHPDRLNMIKFLANNFEEQRWQTAARKNAFSLLGKQRFELAVSFFLLAESLQDAVSVCLRHLKDFQLAIAIARVHEGTDQGPVLRKILESHVIPLALAEAVRVLVSPFADLIGNLDLSVPHVGEPDTDDPALIVLLAELRSRSLQTIHGASYITISSEYKFVLYMARILREMGCHVLALDLVRSWLFAEPANQENAVPAKQVRPNHSPRRRSSFLLQRKSSIIADIPSTVVSRAASPEPAAVRASAGNEEREAVARLAKENRKQVDSIAAFDASAFGF